MFPVVRVHGGCLRWKHAGSISDKGAAPGPPWSLPATGAAQADQHEDGGTMACSDKSPRWDGTEEQQDENISARGGPLLVGCCDCRPLLAAAVVLCSALPRPGARQAKLERRQEHHHLLL